jgi:hypothetical protein
MAHPPPAMGAALWVGGGGGGAGAAAAAAAAEEEDEPTGFDAKEVVLAGSLEVVVRVWANGQLWIAGPQARGPRGPAGGAHKAAVLTRRRSPLPPLPPSRSWSWRWGG